MSAEHYRTSPDGGGSGELRKIISNAIGNFGSATLTFAEIVVTEMPGAIRGLVSREPEPTLIRIPVSSRTNRV